MQAFLLKKNKIKLSLMKSELKMNKSIKEFFIFLQDRDPATSRVLV